MIIVKNEGSDDLVRGRSIGRSGPRIKNNITTSRNGSPNITNELSQRDYYQ